MKKTVKIILIAVTVLSLMLSIVTALNMDWEDDDDVKKKDPVVDSESDTVEDDTPKEVTIHRCTCSVCAENLDFGVYIAGDDSYNIECELTEPFYIGDTVQFAAMGRITRYSSTAFYAEDYMELGGLEGRDHTLDSECYYVWDFECANAASAASVASFGLRDTTTVTTLAAELDVVPGEASEDDTNWTPYY